MTGLISKLTAWLKSKNITSHSVAAFVIGFCVLYDSSPEVRQYIAGLFVGYPIVVTKLGIAVTHILGAVAIWTKYSHSSSITGTLTRAAALAPAESTQSMQQKDEAKQ